MNDHWVQCLLTVVLEGGTDIVRADAPVIITYLYRFEIRWQEQSQRLFWRELYRAQYAI